MVIFAFLLQNSSDWSPSLPLGHNLKFLTLQKKFFLQLCLLSGVVTLSVSCWRMATPLPSPPAGVWSQVEDLRPHFVHPSSSPWRCVPLMCLTPIVPLANELPGVLVIFRAVLDIYQASVNVSWLDVEWQTGTWHKLRLYIPFSDEHCSWLIDPQQYFRDLKGICKAGGVPGLYW